jgi:hypothetical protein
MDCQAKAGTVGFCSVMFSHGSQGGQRSGGFCIAKPRQVTAVKLSHGSFDVLCHNQSRNGSHI